MKLTRQTGLLIAATVVVIAFGALMFATAGQPMSAEGETAQAWVDALCAGRLDELYALSAAPDGVDRAAFEQQVKDYLDTGAVPTSCAGQVNFNLIRTLAVPRTLSGRIDRARYVEEVVLRSGENSQTEMLPLWLYHEVGGTWRVWASFMGATLEPPIAAGGIGALRNSNGVPLGSIQVDGPARVYRGEGQTLIGVPVAFQTLAVPWEYAEARLFAGSRRASALDNADQLPEEWRGDYLTAVSGYNPQNLKQTGTFWFRVPELPGQAALAFTVRTPYSGTLQAVYLDVPLDSAQEAAPFNPFARTRFVEIANDNPTFEVFIDTSGLPAERLNVLCGNFTLVLATDEWKRATDCTFAQGGQQDFLPGEQARVSVTFAGYGITSVDQLRSMSYRRDETVALIRYPLWQP